MKKAECQRIDVFERVPARSIFLSAAYIYGADHGLSCPGHYSASPCDVRSGGDPGRKRSDNLR